MANGKTPKWYVVLLFMDESGYILWKATNMHCKTDTAKMIIYLKELSAVLLICRLLIHMLYYH